ncbi:lipid IV(A) 3-deoxy-D-manno-octulosonic acid transferase [Rheinheimera sp.]|uniref:lipid IV(A) 3-deoxy-D-manno-octulosonic acid transferase n=1 Tax=Rheinheimera sp. TaxID=1869214 RepID=UPI00307D6ABC
MRFALLRWLYNLLVVLLTPLLLLYLLLRSRKDPAYRRRFAERFGLVVPAGAAKGGVLLHTVSVGEFNAAKPLVNQLLASLKLPLLVSCTTPTASEAIQSFAPGQLQHAYLPFDYPWLTKRWLKALSPRLVMVMETELWPNLLQACFELGIPVQLVNARLSARSAKGYRRFYWLTAGLLARISLVQTQDRNSARRFKALGAARVENAGNIKFDLQIPPHSTALAAQLKPQLAGRKVWVAASTHAGEDEVLLQACRELKAQIPELLLVLVPRHKERFDSVATLIEQAGLRYCRRSLQQWPQADTTVWLADSMGELLSWYQLADWVFIGGSLIERGGHNPLEAMAFAKPVLSGPYVFNFAVLFSALKKQQAVQFAADASAISTALMQWQQQPGLAEQLGQAGYQLFCQQQGAVARLLLRTQQLLALQDFVSEEKSSSVLWADTGFSSELSTAGFSGKPAQISADCLRPQFWQQQQAVVGSSKGRHTVWFVKAAGTEWVLRHYYRGGLVGKLNKDWFWPVPVAQSRAMAEFRLLRQMHQAGLPVPLPGLALFQRRGLGYSADILLQRIEGAVDLSQLLQQRALSTAEWQQVGAMIRAFHTEQIWHSDLNCHNILLADGRFYLIDFDKCAQRGGQHWKAATLARLLRSLRKEQQQLPQFHWQETDFQALMLGYELTQHPTEHGSSNQD